MSEAYILFNVVLVNLVMIFPISPPAPREVYKHSATGPIFSTATVKKL